MQLVVREDKSEQFLYKCAEFPAYFGYGRLADYPDYAALGHWHDDIEFSLVLSGGIDYNVNGETVHLNPGEGIFINSRQMHFNFSREHQNGEYICILLHPMLLCASQYVEDNFVAPVLNHPTFSYQVFHAGCDWGRRVCDKLKWMYARQSQPKFQLAIQAAFLQIWEEVYQHAPLSSKSVKSRGQNLNALKDMVAYIQKNYQKKIKLEDIARAGNVSKTTCINIFQKYVNKTPNAYLMEFRLRNGIELLNTTDMTVTEISFEVGFCGSSYFCESFKKVFGCSPLQFRKSLRNIDTDKPKELEILL